jgi:hypothetical protein
VPCDPLRRRRCGVVLQGSFLATLGRDLMNVRLFDETLDRGRCAVIGRMLDAGVHGAYKTWRVGLKMTST